MKVVLIVYVLVLLSFSLKAQSNSYDFNDTTISNSFEKSYKKNNTDLRYYYDEKKQIHNYSSNWDIDGDGKLDSVFFIGNGGAHIYYNLRVILSSDMLVRDYKFILVDFPKLEPVSFLNKNQGVDSLIPQFVVADFDYDKRQDIYIRIDTKTNPIPSFWRKKGITSSHLLVSSNGKRITVKNFSFN